MEHDIRPKEILQSSFDLIGELVKFNVEAFKVFDKVLNSKERVSRSIVRYYAFVSLYRYSGDKQVYCRYPTGHFDFDII